MSNFLQKIFSIKNEQKNNTVYKAITILFIKIKFKNKKATKKHHNKWRELNPHNETVLSNPDQCEFVEVGNYSYGIINALFDSPENNKLRIGHFCSIARNVQFIVASEHPYKGISTFPFKVKILGEKKEATSKGDIILKDDVWIAQNSIILSGVTINQGAIVAAGSVVTKDVPPYAIVAGNPAKVIKYRFEPEIIEKLMQVDYSKLSEEKIKILGENLYTEITKDNIDDLLEKFDLKKSKDPVLSICIPTYNRGKILHKKIMKYLESNNSDFQIIVSDNNSTDETNSLMSSIKDSRFIYKRNDKNIGSFENIISSINIATGKYAMIVMDKDYFIMDCIDEITNYLKKNEFSAGAFKIDYEGDFKTTTIKKQKNKLLDFAFAYRHPSGFFVNRELFLSNNITQKVRELDAQAYAYATDFFALSMCFFGNVCEISIPFIRCTYPPFEGVKHSYTYSMDGKNLFFTPEYIFKIYEIFYEFLKTITNKKLYNDYRLIKKLTYRAYNNCTAGYLNALSQKNICDWYNLSDDFRKKEQKRNLKKDFLRFVLNSNIYEVWYIKFIISLEYFIKLIRK